MLFAPTTNTKTPLRFVLAQMLQPHIEFVLRFIRPLSDPFEFAHSACRHTEHALRLFSYGSRERKVRERRELGVIPRTPLPLYSLWGASQTLGLTLVSRPAEKTVVWLDLTHIPPERIGPTEDYINGRCTDISKTTVAELFESVFGRSLKVNPLTHTGRMVIKSEANATNDGRIVEGPLAQIEANHAYQRLVDNTTEDGKHVEDFRAVIVGNAIPLVYKKRRILARRFESGSMSTELFEAGKVFSASEQAQLQEFARKLCLDFGELDVLRDKSDGQIHIVDANKTSITPPIGMKYEKRFEALRKIGEAFEKEFLN